MTFLQQAALLSRSAATLKVAASRPAVRSAAQLQLRSLATVADTVFPANKAAPKPVYNAPYHFDSEGKPKAVPAALKLKSGQVFAGTSFGAQQSTFGEAVFTTSLVGYPESMTDPSYRGQILVFTQPLIGNYGVPSQEKDQFGLLKYFESNKIQCQGIVVNDYATEYSHWTAVESLGEWCAREGIPAISGVDTRAIVHLLRDNGSTLAKLDIGNEALEHQAVADFPNPNERNLVAEASTKEIYELNPMGDVKIALIDCGVKENILRCLVARGAAVTVFPWNHDFNQVLDQYDGLFISNGPGDPRAAMTTVKNLATAFQRPNVKPIFGICMGNQLMGMAAGMDVYKLQFGNRGHNQPAVNQQNGRCSITSQNHGYALMDASLSDSTSSLASKGWEKYFVNANDGSNEGIRHKTLPFSSVQFHPEAKGGPQDTEYLFDDFLNLARAEKVKNASKPFFVPATEPVVGKPVEVVV
ncbi:Multifunctional pyrimidine synthesis protein CAD [Actinomortierella ambigua]|uniref:Carbamoyl phosphate synthase arginine-specific small chain n=1 Tax=Actinomortierella ambigua TaxID=1343610 RepID=A0A9P6Q2E9_9FUNG|nr:Multifunctional pyrimidine synthesis protein CAD [Actinomortierella ambigua]KAG0259108.1 Multifunctional pyrimidine synthesis protein CAD [Actinomortierella ambigua]